MLNKSLIDKILKQKNKLTELNTNLNHFFVEMEIPGLECTVPFLPIRCLRDFTLFTGAEDEECVRFLSSGSTNDKRATHIFSQKRLQLYAQKSSENFLKFLNHHGFDSKTPIVSLIPPPSVWQNSSLAHMIGMFKSQGFPITYVDVEKDPQSLVTLLMSPPSETVSPRGLTAGSSPSQDMIIFGTTFHHFLVAQHVQKNPSRPPRGAAVSPRGLTAGAKLAVIDTGGTKGRMIVRTRAETQEIFRRAYGNPKEFLFLSEYGMCELSSQAWSLHKMHDGTFKSSDTLIPFSISLREKKVLPEGEKGFLGFIDLLNVEESYPAIITEDIGTVEDQENGIFKLHHRAPLATLKGCSLNVKDNFFFSMDPPVKPGDDKHAQAVSPRDEAMSPRDEAMSPRDEAMSPRDEAMSSRDEAMSSPGLTGGSSPKSLWPPKLNQDLQKSLDSWNSLAVQNPHALKGKRVLILSSANIPISWLYPTRVAGLMGAESVHIKLPSLREADPFSDLIQKQIEDLVLRIGPSVFPTRIVIEKDSNLSSHFDDFDFLIAFGTNSTVETFQNKLKGTKTKLIPQGEVHNSLNLTLEDNPKKIAGLCSLWLGRGCLTPVCLFMESDNTNLTADWVQSFQNELECSFQEYYKELKCSPQFAHDHNTAFVESVMKSFNIDISKNLFRGEHTCVVNFTSLHPENAELLSKIDFSLAGCGFIFILNKKCRDAFPQIAQTKVTPSLADPHGGKTWEEWFL